MSFETIKIIEGGPLATIQDRGRFAYLDRGVPTSGAMDQAALRIGNRLVGNSEDAAAIEITLGGFQAEFLRPTRFVLTGADMGARVNTRPVQPWTLTTAGRGDLLAIPGPGTGCRTYLALAGGVAVDPVMGSRSTYVRGGFGGHQGRALARGDVLGTDTPTFAPIPSWKRHLIPPYVPNPVLRVIPGPQDDRFTPDGLETFISQEYTLTDHCDRMGMLLRGAAITHRRGADIISDGIVNGTVQVPGNGQPIILGADSQTVGGYAKIATIISVDLPLLAQALPGARIRFAAIDLVEARGALLRFEFLIRRLGMPNAVAMT
jgi:biotin-dependent carboxylase-like uncharacterized protein